MGGMADGEGTFTGSYAFCLKVFDASLWNIKSNYSGSWKHNLLDGYGEFSRDSGIANDEKNFLYLGHWKNSYKHGPGCLVYSEKHFIDGVFEYGFLQGF